MVVSTRISQQSIQQKTDTPGRHGRLGANSAGDEKAVMPLIEAQALPDNQAQYDQQAPMSAQMLNTVQQLLQEFTLSTSETPKEHFILHTREYMPLEIEPQKDGYSTYQSKGTGAEEEETVTTFNMDV